MAKAARFLLYGLIVWAPLPLGSNRPVFWAVNGLLACVILILFLGGEINRGWQAGFDWQPAAWVLSGVLLWTFWMLFQAVRGLPGPFEHPFWVGIAQIRPDVSGAVSANPGATLTTIAEALPVALLSIVAMRLAMDRRRGIFLLRLVAAVTIVLATYGLVAQHFNLPQVFLVGDSAYSGFLKGTFINRNTAATFFVIGLVVVSALMAARIESWSSISSHGHSRAMLAVDLLRRNGVNLLLVLILATALLNTGSRAGSTAGLIGILIVALASTGFIKDRRVMGAALLLGLGAIFVIALVASDLLFSRVESSLSGDVRIDLYRDALQMIGARPILGHGAGTFADIFPFFQTADGVSEYVWNRAHSSFLQGAAELGIPMFAFIVAIVCGVLGLIVSEICRRSGTAPVAVAAMGVTAVVAFHSAVDFSVQTQAIAILGSVLLGAGLGDALRLARSRKSETYALMGQRLQPALVAIPRVTDVAL